MKYLILLAALGLSSGLTAGETKTEKLCKLFSGESLVEIYSKNSMENKKYNRWEQSMIMNYVERQELFGEDGPLKTFEDVLKEFTDEHSYDELHIALFQDKKTKKKYVNVWSYPGDNHYGVYMDTKGNIVADIIDSDLYIGDQGCYEFEEN